jgi:hypothetical protein
MKTHIEGLTTIASNFGPKEGGSTEHFALKIHVEGIALAMRDFLDNATSHGLANSYPYKRMKPQNVNYFVFEQS